MTATKKTPAAKSPRAPRSDKGTARGTVKPDVQLDPNSRQPAKQVRQLSLDPTPAEIDKFAEDLIADATGGNQKELPINLDSLPIFDYGKVTFVDELGLMQGTEKQRLAFRPTHSVTLKNSARETTRTFYFRIERTGRVLERDRELVNNAAFKLESMKVIVELLKRGGYGHFLTRTIFAQPTDRSDGIYHTYITDRMLGNSLPSLSDYMTTVASSGETVPDLLGQPVIKKDAYLFKLTYLHALPEEKCISFEIDSDDLEMEIGYGEVKFTYDSGCYAEGIEYVKAVLTVGPITVPLSTCVQESRYKFNPVKNIDTSVAALLAAEVEINKVIRAQGVRKFDSGFKGSVDFSKAVFKFV